MSEASALEDHADEVILPIIALEAGYNGAVINITKDLNLYVRVTGSDLNTGYRNTDQHAFQTGTRAYDEATRFVPSNGAKIIINLDSGLFAPIQAIGGVPGGSVIVRGLGPNFTSIINPATPALGNAAVYASGAAVQVEQLRIGGNGLGNGLFSANGGVITVGAGVDFGAVDPTVGSHMKAGSNSQVYNRLPYSISGNAGRHLEAWGPGAIIEGGGSTVTISPNITVGDAFALAGNEGTVYNAGTTWNGYANVTGRKFYAYQWGFINTEGAGVNYLPGTVAGSTSTGGRYDNTGGAGPPGPAGPMGPKAMSLQLPVVGDEVTMFYAKDALTITQMEAVVRGTTPSVTWTVLWAPTRSAAGTPVVTAGTVTNSTTGQIITTFNSANIPAGSWVWMKATATSGIVLEFGLTLSF
jgi:hypothetical protein